MRWRWAAARRSASSSSPPTPTALPVCDALVAGVAVGCGAGRRSAVRPSTAFARRLEAAPGACRRRWNRGGRLPRPCLAAMPVASSKACRPKWYDLWLSHVREARPIYRHGWRTVLAIVSLPLTGLIGWLLLVWFNRRDPDMLRRTLAATAPLVAAMLLLLWQTRTGPAAQMLSATGATALLWISVPWVAEIEERRSCGSFGTAALVVLGMGAAVPCREQFLSEGEEDARNASRRQGEPPVRVAMGTEACRPAAEGHGVHLRRPRPEADHRHASQRRRRPVSPQWRADR